jgi:tetratricopeptide (TPR) repeat protein
MSGEGDSIKARHARYMLDLAENTATQLRGPEQQVGLARLTAELDNIRAALRWMLDHGELEMATRIQIPLTMFWWVQGYVAEAGRWADEVLSRAEMLAPLALARAQLSSGLAAAWEGDYSRAVSLMERALSQFRELGDSQGAGVAQMALAYVSPEAGDYEHSEALLLESAADLYQSGDLWAVNVALQSRAELALAAGDANRAGELYQDSLELARRQSDRRGSAQALLGLGFVKLATGDMADASKLLRQSVLLSLELGNRELLAYALRGLAGVARNHHQLTRAARLLGAAQALSDKAGTVDWPVRRTLYSRVEEDVRSALGEQRFSAAWNAGRSLSLAAATLEVPHARAAAASLAV